MTMALKKTTLLETLGPGDPARPLRATAGPAEEEISSQEYPALPSPEPGPFRLHREAEVPRMVASLGAPELPQASSAPPGETQRPDELATLRQENRQIVAISRVVCQAVAEVLAGLRPVQQMSRWLVPEVHDKVRQRGEILARHRQGSTVYGGPLTFRSIRATHVRPGVWEVSVVFSDERRTRACAMRFQAHRRRWRVSAMELG